MRLRALFLFTLIMTLPPMPLVAQEPAAPSADEAAVRAVVQKYVNAREAKDPKAIAAIRNMLPSLNRLENGEAAGNQAPAARDNPRQGSAAPDGEHQTLRRPATDGRLQDTPLVRVSHRIHAGHGQGRGPARERQRPGAAPAADHDLRGQGDPELDPVLAPVRDRPLHPRLAELEQEGDLAVPARDQPGPARLSRRGRSSTSREGPSSRLPAARSWREAG